MGGEPGPESFLKAMHDYRNNVFERVSTGACVRACACMCLCMFCCVSVCLFNYRVFYSF